jgi:hypothetical protein
LAAGFAFSSCMRSICMMNIHNTASAPPPHTQ